MLSNEDREALRSACCPCGGGETDECFVLLDTDWDGVNGTYAAVEQIVERAVTAALNEAADALVGMADTCPSECDLCDVYSDAAIAVRDRTTPT